MPMLDNGTVDMPVLATVVFGWGGWLCGDLFPTITCQQSFKETFWGVFRFLGWSA
jgi:hypothetical protein